MFNRKLKKKVKKLEKYVLELERKVQNNEYSLLTLDREVCEILNRDTYTVKNHVTEPAPELFEYT